MFWSLRLLRVERTGIVFSFGITKLRRVSSWAGQVLLMIQTGSLLSVRIPMRITVACNSRAEIADGS